MVSNSPQVYELAQVERPYQTPTIVDYGDLLDLTAGTSDGCYLDAAFPAQTMKSELSFSC